MIRQGDEHVVVDRGLRFAAQHLDDLLGDKQMLGGDALDEALQARQLVGIVEGEDLVDGCGVELVSALTAECDPPADGDSLGAGIVDHRDVVVVDAFDNHGYDLGSSNRLANQGEGCVTARDGAGRALHQREV